MAKTRVHELAKELNVGSKDIIEKAATINISLNNHMSAIGEIDAEKIANLFRPTVKKEISQERKAPENKLPVTGNQLPENKNVVSNHPVNSNTDKRIDKKPEQRTDNKPGVVVEHRHDHKKPEYQHRNDGNIDKHYANPISIEKAEKEDKKEATHHHDGVHQNASFIHDKSGKHNHNPNETLSHIGTLDLSKKEHKKYSKKKVEDGAFEEEEIKVFEIGDEITVKDLADKIEKPAVEIIKFLMTKGVFANINQGISYELAEAVADQYDILIERKIEDDIKDIVYCEDVGVCELKDRPPVVVVMGHVDHGKTSLLDAIKKTDVVAGEHGGITQHIGASQVEIKGKKITFLDTPGHEAFTAMRLRGARVTDIAILVVAADDGVMPQTIEAINHAKAADIPIIVAINKIDKPGADPERVKQELTQYGLVAEEWGGQTICTAVSAKTEEGIDTLLEMILLVSEMQELKAGYDTRAKGTVIEARLDKNKGVITTLLVDNGTIRVGDPILAGKTYGKVKAMVNYKHEKIKSATPSTPVEILGFNEVPEAGDIFYITKDDKQAKVFAEKAAMESREKRIVGAHKNISLDALFSQIQTGEIKKLNLIIKADVQGSVEALRQSLEKLSNKEVIVSVIHCGAGAITESDVMLAAASGAIIMAFNVIPQTGVRKYAEENMVDLRQYNVIYKAIEDIEAAMKGMLDPEFIEKVIGEVEIRDTFKVTNVGTVAGCYVKDGYITRSSTIRLTRESIVLYEGPIASLKRFKDDAKEVKAGFECGMLIEKFSDVKAGDLVEAYIMEEVKRA